jgi:hypothetical protein
MNVDGPPTKADIAYVMSIVRTGRPAMYSLGGGGMQRSPSELYTVFAIQLDGVEYASCHGGQVAVLKRTNSTS